MIEVIGSNESVLNNLCDDIRLLERADEPILPKGMKKKLEAQAASGLAPNSLLALPSSSGLNL